ncbi:MAG: hypothetical protein ACI8ZM_002501 [Crocinitomix sp.]|jgi:hypothetical protein
MFAHISKLTAIGFLFFFLSGFVYHDSPVPAKSNTTYVYICVTKNSYAYHYDYYCRGLKQCKGEKRKVTLDEAKGKYERKLCGWED